MLGFLGELKGLVKYKKCLIDNSTFRLHYQFTFCLLCLACLLQTANQYFGDPIDCMHDNAKIPESVFETYCWIHGTFTLTSQLSGKKGTDNISPGVGHGNGDEIRHAWYQWVVFVLFFQALLCYIPHFLWKTWEGGKLSLLLQNLDENTLDIEPQKNKDRRSVIVNYIHRNINTHNLYAYKFIFCEFLNLVNIIGQMYLMDVFFGGQFSKFGVDVLSVPGIDMENRVDPMAKVFPKMGKCTFHMYGPGGTIQNIDGICLLPINIINEKIFVFLWFWYLALITWTCVFFCFRVVTIVSKYTRYLIFCGRTKSSSRRDVAIVMEKLWFGDWFILMQLCKNINPLIFHDLVTDLRDRLETKSKRKDNLKMFQDI